MKIPKQQSRLQKHHCGPHVACMVRPLAWKLNAYLLKLHREEFLS